MSVNSVRTGLQPSYRLLSGSDSPSAKPAARVTQGTQKTFAETDRPQAASVERSDAPQDPSTGSQRAGNGAESRSTLEEALRQGHAASASSTADTSEPTGGRTSPGIAVYQRISQYGNTEPSTSALFQNWNRIMQAGQDSESAATAFAKAFSQAETPGLQSGVLDLTA